MHRIGRLLLYWGLAFAGQAHASVDLPHRIEQTDNEIRLKTSNARAEPARCRLQLQLLPIDATRQPVHVDVDLVVPAKAVDLVVWRVVGDVAAWRITGHRTLFCGRHSAALPPPLPVRRPPARPAQTTAATRPSAG